MSAVVKLNKAEYEIALEQLERLRDISRQRLLSPDEVKTYDLLVKNLRLIENDPTVIEGQAKPKELTVEEALTLLDPPKPEVIKVKRKKKVKSIDEETNSD